MAKSSNSELAVKPETGMAKWEEELAKQATAAAEQEASAGGGQFFSLRGGQLKLNGATLPDNQMAVVILDAVIENAYYEGAFDPEDPQPPVCYALGRDDKTMTPHDDAQKPQAKGCADCPHNQWGSKGRGKVCKNRRRLALIPGGTISGSHFTAYATAEEITNAPLAYLALPPTSIAAFATYVKQLAGALNRPPRAVFTRVGVAPDPKTQFKVTFTALGQVPGELIGAVMDRSKEVAAVIEFPYQANGRADAAPAGKGKDGKKARKY